MHIVKATFKTFEARLVLAGVLAIWFASGLTALIGAHDSAHEFKERFVASGRAQARLLAAVAARVDESDRSALRDLASDALTSARVMHVRVAGAGGRILHEQARGDYVATAMFSLPPVPGSRNRDAQQSESGGEWRFIAPLRADGRPVLSGVSTFDPAAGYVQLIVNNDRHAAYARAVLWRHLWLAFVLAGLSSAVFAFAVATMTAPLRRLSARLRTAAGGEMPDTGCGPTDFAAMHRAITEISRSGREREVSLQRSRDEAMRAALAQAELAASVSHELRTPLNGIVGMLQMLRQMPLEGRAHEYLDIAWNSSNALSGLIDGILDFSSIEAGKARLNVTTTDVNLLLDETLAVFAARALQKGVALDHAVEHGVPVRIRTDPMRLRQIISNLVGNAVKFTEQGVVRVRLQTAHGAGREVLRLTVADTGIGMTEEEKSHIFEQYRQARDDTARRFGGTGLGLAITRQLVSLMGGAIHVDSVPHMGSTFTVDVPLERADAPTAVRITHAPAAGSGAGRLLVAEDNRTNQLVLINLLTGLGYRVDIVENGAQAVEAAASQHYDAILMDCRMPVMDGYEAAMEIRRAHSNGRRVPILAVTADTREEDRRAALDAGMDDWISKPVTTEALRGRLTALIGIPPAETQAGMLMAPAWAAVSPVDTRLLGGLDASLGTRLGEALTAFLDDTPREIGRLRRHIAAGEYAAAAAIAHAVKGSSSQLGAGELAELASAAERRLRSAAAPGAPPADDCSEILLDAFGRAAPAYRSMLARSAARPVEPA